jgi:hypothetical protein
MAVRIQGDFPELTELAKGSPMLSNLPCDHPAWLHPIQSYIWMHDTYRFAREVLDIEMPEEQYRRFDLMEFARFMEDHSGRSTGKTMNYLIYMACASICCNVRQGVWLGQNKDIGVEIFDKYFEEWIKYKENFYRFVTAKGNHKPKVTHGQAGAKVIFWNGSRLQSITPDPVKEYKKMQSWRFNDGLFNEWPNWPYIRDIPDKVEPIFTNTNVHYRRTRLFREAMEIIMGIELGRLTNDDLKGRHKRKGYVPRKHITTSPGDVAPKRVLELFYINFEACFGFDYRNGVKDADLQFPEIENENGIVMFFRNYDEGDPAYMNKLIYDGSAKRPSDESYWLHKFFTQKIKEGNALYAQYRVGIDDIPEEWDGIIFDSTIIEKARESELAEDFKRIYGGYWTEGRAKNPFAWTEVVAANIPGWRGLLRRADDGEIYVGAVDSAQGTDATFKTDEGVSDGRGDDGVAAIFRLGDGTAKKPHKLCRVKIAEDVRSEPWAYDVQEIESNFEAPFWMIDPGGGGKGLLEKLSKKRVSKTDIFGETHTMDVVPMLPWDHENPQDSKPNICIFSLSNEMITATYVETKTSKALLQYADQLNNQMVKLMQDAIKNKTVGFPEYLDHDQIIKLHNDGEIGDDELENLMHIRQALAQLVLINYKTDKHNKRDKTKHGVFTYTSKGKKDAAWTIMMGHMMCDIIVKMNELIEQSNDETGFLPDVG